MRLLLDTHSLIWLLGAPNELREQTRLAIADPQNDVYASAVSVWEAAIKARTGKLVLPPNFLPAMRASGIRVLAIPEDHALKAADLPMHHKDPFDCMLIAQAISDGLTLISRDRHMPAYGGALLVP